MIYTNQRNGCKNREEEEGLRPSFEVGMNIEYVHSRPHTSTNKNEGESTRTTFLLC